MRLSLLAAPVVLALAPLSAAQSTWYVDVNGSAPGTGSMADPYTSIDYALSQGSTVSGDLVLVAPGTYNENVTFPAKGVRVMSTAGPATTWIDAGGSGSAVSFLGSDGTIMILDGFTITGGVGTNTGGLVGGGIYGMGALICIVDCIIEHNDAERGGGLYVDNCTTEAIDCIFRENRTMGGFYNTGGAGLFLSGGNSWLLNCRVEDNTAGTVIVPGRGGGVWSAGTLLARRTVFKNNVAEAGGGGLFGEGRLEMCHLTGNQGQFGGGAQQSGGTLEIYDSLIELNRADSASGTDNFGGGVYGGANVVRSTLCGNTSFGDGAAAAGGVSLTDCTITDNHSFTAFGFGDLAGAVEGCTLLRCVVSGNSANGGGFSPYRSVGGGAANSTLDECDVYGNMALGSTDASGGGLANCVARFTSVYDNHSDGLGGGVDGGSLERCTVVGNTATVGGDGVWVADFDNGSVLDSIVWNNGAEEIRVESFGTASVTYSDVQGGFAGTGNIDEDPDFWNEAARDFHLQSTSPCIDTGNPASPTDPDGSRADMGRYWYDPNYGGGADGEDRRRRRRAR